MSKSGGKVTLNLDGMSMEEANGARKLLERLLGANVFTPDREFREPKKRKRKRRTKQVPRAYVSTPESSAAREACLARLSMNWAEPPKTGATGSAWGDALASIVCGMEAADAQEAAASEWIEGQGPFGQLTTLQAVRAVSGFSDEAAAARTVKRLWARIVDHDEALLQQQLPNHWQLVL